MQKQFAQLHRESGIFDGANHDEHAGDESEDRPGDSFGRLRKRRPLPEERTRQKQQRARHGHHRKRKQKSGGDHIRRRNNRKHPQGIAEISLMLDRPLGRGQAVEVER